MRIPVHVICNLCGSEKTVLELGNGQAACPHCDRIDCRISTCEKEPCAGFRRAKEAKDQ